MWPQRSRVSQRLRGSRPRMGFHPHAALRAGDGVVADDHRPLLMRSLAGPRHLGVWPCLAVTAAPRHQPSVPAACVVPAAPGPWPHGAPGPPRRLGVPWPRAVLWVWPNGAPGPHAAPCHLAHGHADRVARFARFSRRDLDHDAHWPLVTLDCVLGCHDRFEPRVFGDPPPQVDRCWSSQ